MTPQRERLIAAIERLADAQQSIAEAAQEKPSSGSAYSIDDLEERARIRLKNALDLALEYHRETNAYGQTSIRMALIFNGTGILIIMNFVSSAVRNGVQIASTVTDQLSVGLWVYICGAVMAIVGSVSGYFGNMHGTRARAYEHFVPVLVQEPKGFREVRPPRDKRNASNSAAYVADNHALATSFQLAVVSAMIVAYVLFGVGTYYAHSALMAALQDIGGVISGGQDGAVQ